MTTLDARELAPPDAEVSMLSAFHHLCVSESMEIVHDHMPRELFMRLRAEVPGSFTWECVEAGPPVWRIRVERLATWWADGQCCGTCGGLTRARS